MIVIQQLRNRFIRFMYGRYGVDQFYKGLIGMAFGLIILNLLIQSTIITAISFTVFLYAYYRVFSKRIYQRQQENIRYTKFMTPIHKSTKLTLRQIKDIKSYRYRKCPSCGQTLRLKRKIGTHSTICPKCKKKMAVKIHI